MIRSLMIAGLAALVAGCGFTPLYAERNGQLSAGLSAIEVEPILSPDRAGFELQKALRERLQPDGTVQYVLRVDARETRETLAVTQAGNIVRNNYRLTARYTLTDRQTREKRQGTVTSVAGYGAVASQYASMVGEDDAVRKAASEVADKMEIELALFLRGARSKMAPVIDGEELLEEPLDPYSDLIDR